MKFSVKSAGLIIAIVMVFGSGVYFVNEINARGTTYKIGARGPGGGFVFYDKGNNNGGWRYLEAAPVDRGEKIWGCYGKSIPGASGTAIGTGKANTAAIISSCEESGIAAKVAVAYRDGNKSDWFLPSKDELNLMYTNLHKTGISSFNLDAVYWSSSEMNYGNAWYLNFCNGSQNAKSKLNNGGWVRAVRAF